jgi:hypothetical protein
MALNATRSRASISDHLGPYRYHLQPYRKIARTMAEVLPLQDDDQPKPTPQPIPKKKGVILGPDGKP